MTLHALKVSLHAFHIIYNKQRKYLFHVIFCCLVTEVQLSAVMFKLAYYHKVFPSEVILAYYDT